MEGHLRSVQTPDDQMVEALRTLKIDSLLAGFGGLDTRHHWENTLPLEDQKLLVVARVLAVRPRFTFVDRPSSTLHDGKVEWILGLLGERGISYVVLEDETASADLALYDSLLELKEGGAWSYKSVRDGRIVEAEAGVPSTVPPESGAPRT